VNAQVGPPAGRGARRTAERSPVAKRISGQCGLSVVTTTSPTSPSGTGSPVPGRTISPTTPSSTTMPSRASDSWAIRPRSAVP
jgi:hypothetical protein